MHEADEPNAVIDLLDPQSLACHDDRDVELLSVDADAAAIGDERIPVLEGIIDLRQALGGIGPVIATGHYAGRKGVQTVVHAWGGAACVMSNYHCAFALGAHLAEYPIPPFPLRNELLTEPFHIVDGMLQPPNAPGLGINLTVEIEREFRFREDATYRGLAVQ